MTSNFNPRFTACLLAGLALSSSAAQAATCCTVSTSGESVITIGMSSSEVQQLLGRPSHNVQYRAAPGPTWSYRVTDALFGRTLFVIEFGPDQKVIAKGEMVIGSEKPS